MSEQEDRENRKFTIKLKFGSANKKALKGGLRLVNVNLLWVPSNREVIDVWEDNWTGLGHLCRLI